MAFVYKIKTKYSTDLTGRELLLPAICTENGILISHLRYLAENANRSQSWRERSLFSLILLIKYINANQGCFVSTTKLLKSFVLALVEGTINPITSEDPSELFWSPRKQVDVNCLLSHITRYTDYLARQDGSEYSRINPFTKASSLEQRLNWCAYYHKNANVFLNHLSDNADSRKHLIYSREIKGPIPPLVNTEAVVRFPDHEFKNLMLNGFVFPHSNEVMESHQKYDYKNQAATILLNNGGLRISELFHIYISDIVVDKKNQEAVVRVYHPSSGESPDKKYRTRREFLAKYYGLRPRNDYPKSERLHSGWKDPLLTDRRYFFQVFFCPPEKATEFLSVWVNYLKYQRVDPPHDYDHPYAFTNSTGYPETIKNFQRQHASAVRRIGLVPQKYNGTTPHGHRHAYGYRLAQYGFSQPEIQKAMHHKSSLSCLVYIQPTAKELREKMRKVEI